MASVEPSGGGQSQRGRKQKKWMARKRIGFHIDMTPYVDVIMLLLTFFIMTTTLNQPQVMQINLPKGDKDDKIQINMGNVVFIRLSEKGSIALSRGKDDGTEGQPERVEMKKLKERIESLGAANKDLVMILKFSRKAKYSNMIDVLDEINKSSIEKRYSFSKMEDADQRVLDALGG